jgi:hypothetical protein
MSKPNDPAFPARLEDMSVEGHPIFTGKPGQFGLTKRELFAAMAMQGLAAASDCPMDPFQVAVTWADRLLDELARRGDPDKDGPGK